MPCPPSVPISIIPPTSQGGGPLVWQNGNIVNRLNAPLNPSFFVYNGGKSYWADGSALAPIYLPNLQQNTVGSITYLISQNTQGQLGYVPASQFGAGGAYLANNQTFTGVNTFTQTIIGSISGNAGTAGAAINFTGTLGGDVTGTQNATSVVKVNGLAVPISKTLVGTNSSGQFVDASSATIANNTTGNANTATTSTNLAGGLAGQVVYQTGSGTTGFTAAGTAGQLLVSNGTSAPTFQVDHIGTNTNNNAATGYVGEYVSSQVLAASAPAFAGGGIRLNITSISLTAGDWDVTANLNISTSGAVTGGIYAAGISTTSATYGSQDTYIQNLITYSGGTSIATPLPTVRLSLSATTTVYFVANGDATLYAAGPVKAYGTILARRVR